MKTSDLANDILYIKESLKRIEDALDDMLPSESLSNQSKGERTFLVLANHSKKDIHIQVGGDVHTGNWGPHQVNHNDEPEVKSCRIDFGSKATYHIKVWQNNNGKPGKFLGEFDHGIRFNAAGNRDHLEFTIVKVNRKTYLKAFSLRDGAEIALLIWLGAR